MLKLRTILLCNYPYYILLVICLIVSMIRLSIPRQSKYTENSIRCEGIIINYKIYDDKINMTIKNREKILVNYYLKNKNDNHIFNDISLGDLVEIKGEFIKPEKNTTKNLFNYRRYLYNKNTFFIVNATSYKKISSSINPYYKVKQFILDRTIDNPYLMAFILGNKSLVSKEALISYQENGISHLFAISGMHITLLSSLINKLLKKIKVNEQKRFLIISLFLIFYLFITGLSSSTFRGVLFYIFFSINKIYYFHIKPINIFIVILSVVLFVNPYFIYDVGFQYSFLISFSLLAFSKFITGNYLVKLLKTSFISFVVSLPISLFNYHQINILSIIYNLFYVPLVSFIIFPFSIFVVIFKPLLPIYNLLTNFMEISSMFFNKIEFLKLVFPQVNVIFYFIYLCFGLYVIICLTRNKKCFIYIYFVLLFFHYISPSLIQNNYLKFIDVGQGDLSFIHLNNKNIMIDTGGKISYSDNDTSGLFNNTIEPLFKSLGIKKINYLILTHGDYDHMGEAINLVENFKVEKVIFNCGPYNDLEEELIKVLDKKHIKYYSCIKELNINNNNKLYFLQTKEYDNENDNSNVIYAELYGYKFMFMGDAGIEKEKDILDKYNLPDINILKVGHHGSQTSSSKEFIDEINPTYSIISVGKNNRYGHPNKEVLENLKESKIYRTDQDGSIVFKIKNDKLKIETCAP